MIKYYCDECGAECGPQEIAIRKCLTVNCGGNAIPKEVKK